MVFQIFLVAFAVIAIYKTWRQYQARHVSKYWLLLFGGFWVIVALVAISPDTTSVIANMVGVGRGSDLLVYIAVVVLFYMVYRLLVTQQRLSEEITELVRKLAIRDANKPEDKP